MTREDLQCLVCKEEATQEGLLLVHFSIGYWNAIFISCVSSPYHLSPSVTTHTHTPFPPQEDDSAVNNFFCFKCVQSISKTPNPLINFNVYQQVKYVLLCALFLLHRKRVIVKPTQYAPRISECACSFCLILI